MIYIVCQIDSLWYDIVEIKYYCLNEDVAKKKVEELNDGYLKYAYHGVDKYVV